MVSGGDVEPFASVRSSAGDGVVDSNLTMKQRGPEGKDPPRVADLNPQPKRKTPGEAARDQAPLLRKGEVLQGLFQVEDQLGGGGFGQIFKAYRKEYGQRVVLKVEPPRGDLRRAKLEMTVLMLLRGKPHIPMLYGCGKVRDCPYIVMQMLGRNLSDLRRRQPERCLSGATVFRVSQHVVTALRSLHETGYIHRDVKASNCCIGLGSVRRKVHLIDFGMVRRVRDMEGNLRPARKYAPFRGTVRYVSTAMHQRKEVGPGDDLVSWFYAMVELLNGQLPWSSLEKTADILKSKSGTPVKDLCDSHPPGMLKFALMVLGIRYDQMPNYEKIQKLLKGCMGPEVTETSPFDWELSAPQGPRSRAPERSVMASVGTELPPSIADAPPPPPRKGTRRARTPPTNRKKSPKNRNPMPEHPQPAVSEKRDRTVEVEMASTLACDLDRTQPSCDSLRD